LAFRDYFRYYTMDWTTGVQFSAGARKGFFSLPPRLNRLWVPPSILSNE